jgi:peptidase E
MAEQNGFKFELIDNSKVGREAELESEKLLSCGALLIAGVNTFGLLHNLKKSKLFETVQKLNEKEEFVIAGFSAGALILTPSIESCGLNWH